MSRLLLLGVPSAILLALLVYHSARALPRSRALAFWIAVCIYGVLRGIGVRLVTERALGGSFPYVIHEPLASFFGVSLQEVCGWAIAAYLAWWVGYQVARRLEGSRPPRLFPQLVWASLFLGALSWAVETTAVASGWWHWTIPAQGGWLGNVPFIALVDWSFVGLDFLLPFLVLTSPAPRASPTRFLTLGVFPLHFAAHAFTHTPFQWLPIPVFHLVHWILMALLLWLALRSSVEDAAFEADKEARWIPFVCLGLMFLDLALAQVFWLARPELLLTSLIEPALLLVVAVALTAAILRWGARGGISRAGIVMVLLAVLALTTHSSAARREREFRAGLAAALAARDRGDLAGAIQKLLDLRGEHPRSHAAHGFLGEIYYRLKRWPEAESAFQAAIDSKSDFRMGHRHLAVLDLLQNDVASARERTAQARRIAPDDLELEYLWYRSRGEVPPALWSKAAATGPQAIETLAALAFEVGDVRGCAQALDLGLQRWPQRQSLYPQRLNLALAEGDMAIARSILEEWLKRFPKDEQASGLARQLIQ